MYSLTSKLDVQWWLVCFLQPKLYHFHLFCWGLFVLLHNSLSVFKMMGINTVFGENMMTLTALKFSNVYKFKKWNVTGLCWCLSKQQGRLFWCSRRCISDSHHKPKRSNMIQLSQRNCTHTSVNKFIQCHWSTLASRVTYW